MSVRELDESQKVLCRLNLSELHADKDQSNESVLLTTSTDQERISLLHAKIEVYEQMLGAGYRMRCITR